LLPDGRGQWRTILKEAKISSSNVALAEGEVQQQQEQEGEKDVNSLTN
jgi:hypothetical protein